MVLFLLKKWGVSDLLKSLQNIGAPKPPNKPVNTLSESSPCLLPSFFIYSFPFFLFLSKGDLLVSLLTLEEKQRSTWEICLPRKRWKLIAKWEDVSFSTLTVWSKRQLPLTFPWRVHRQLSRGAPGLAGSSANSRNHCSTLDCCCRVIPVPLGSPECIKLTLFPGKAKCLGTGWCSIIMGWEG